MRQSIVIAPKENIFKSFRGFIPFLLTFFLLLQMNHYFDYRCSFAPLTFLLLFFWRFFKGENRNPIATTPQRGERERAGGSPPRVEKPYNTESASDGRPAWQMQWTKKTCIHSFQFLLSGKTSIFLRKVNSTIKLIHKSRKLLL